MNYSTKDRRYLMFGGIKMPGYLLGKLWHFFFKYANLFILFGNHFINKMLFGPTLFCQNYPDDLVGET